MKNRKTENPEKLKNRKSEKHEKTNRTDKKTEKKNYCITYILYIINMLLNKKK